MPGLTIGNRLNFILKPVIMENLESLKQLVQATKLQLKLAGYLASLQ